MLSPYDRVTFEILAGTPNCHTSVIGEASDLSEAIELCFPMETTDAEMIWCGISVPINYKYDLSVIYEDIVEMLRSCLNSEPVSIYFGSNTFSGSLEIREVDNKLRITGKWESVSGNKEDELNRAPELVVDRTLFVRAWSELLKNAMRAVCASSLRVRLQPELDELQRLLDRVDSMS